MALPTFASVIGSRSRRTSSRVTGTVSVTFSVTTNLRRRARPTSCERGADVHALLGAGHGVVGGRAGGVVPDGAAGVGVGVPGGRWCRPAGGRVSSSVVRADAHAVVAVQLLLLGGGEVTVGVDLRGVLDPVLAHGHPEAVVGEVGVPDRDEGLLRAEQAGLDGDPLGPAGLVVEVDLGRRADLLAALVVDVVADHAVEGVCSDHESVRSHHVHQLVRSPEWVTWMGAAKRIGSVRHARVRPGRTRLSGEPADPPATRFPQVGQAIGRAPPDCAPARRQRVRGHHG